MLNALKGTALVVALLGSIEKMSQGCPRGTAALRAWPAKLAVTGSSRERCLFNKAAGLQELPAL